MGPGRRGGPDGILGHLASAPSATSSPAASYRLGFPQLAGYQLSGTVTRAGPDRTSSLRPGDRVFAHLFWNNAFPGESFTWVGAHASLHTGPETGNIHRLPEDIPDDEASLLSVASIGLPRRDARWRRRRLAACSCSAWASSGCSRHRRRPLRGVRGRGRSPPGTARRGDHGRRPGGARRRDAAATWDRLGALGPFDAVLETTAGEGIIEPS